MDTESLFGYFFTLGIGLIILCALIIIPVVIVYLIGLWKVFEKAGRKGWEALIPCYNSWVLTEITGAAWWYAVIIIVDSLNLLNGPLGDIISIAACVSWFFVFYNLGKKFHKGISFSILTTIFTFVMIPIAGFSKSYQFDGSVMVSENGPIGDAKQNNSYTGTEYKREENFGNNDVNYCQHCGGQIKNGAKYCSHCGTEIKR